VYCIAVGNTNVGNNVTSISCFALVQYKEEAQKSKEHSEQMNNLKQKWFN